MLGQRGEEVLALPDGFSLTKQDRAVPFPLATVTPGAGDLLPLLTKGFPIRAGTFVPTEVTVTSGLARLKTRAQHTENDTGEMGFRPDPQLWRGKGKAPTEIPETTRQLRGDERSFLPFFF